MILTLTILLCFPIATLVLFLYGIYKRNKRIWIPAIILFVIVIVISLEIISLSHPKRHIQSTIYQQESK